MSYRGVELAVGEWFHCYTRTIDRSRVFGKSDLAERFLETLYLANQSAPLPIIANLRRTHTYDEIFAIERKAPIVAVAAYSIMPTHYHLLVQPLIENGLSAFMHKVGTSFTKSYNERHGRAGNLFIKPFRARHISNDAYFYHIPSYIHLNVAEVFEPGWKDGRVRNIDILETQLRTYPHSSLPDYEGVRRMQRSILHEDSFELFKANLSPLRACMDEASEYYRFLDLDL